MPASSRLFRACLFALGRRSWILAAQHLLQRVLDTLTEHPPASSPAAPLPGPRAAAAAALFAIAICAYLVLLGTLRAVPQYPWNDDQGAFLNTAREIHDAGGLPWLARALWSGRFAEANRHPLYLALLSVSPTFAFGQWLSAILGTLTLVTLTALAARKLGLLTAGLFAVLLATNAAFCLFSTRVVCDVLMILWCGAAWMIHLPRRGDESAPSAARHVASRAALTGALLGLAWLTKGTGLVFLAAYVLWLVLECARHLWRRSSESLPPATQPPAAKPVRTGLQIALTCLAFGLVSLPLLVRNSVRFGNPVHNVNSLLLFADDFAAFDGMLARGTTTGEAARAYLATHFLADIAERELSGLVWEAFIILRSLGPLPLDDSRVLCGFPLALAALLMMLARRRPADRLLAVWGLVSWIVFAWYVPIAAGERFIVPLLAPLLLLAADAIGCWTKRRPRNGARLITIAVAAALWAGACVVATAFLTRVY